MDELKLLSLRVGLFESRACRPHMRARLVGPAIAETIGRTAVGVRERESVRPQPADTDTCTC
eukprot:5547130-Amphidinium_carterae.2